MWEIGGTTERMRTIGMQAFHYELITIKVTRRVLQCMVSTALLGLTTDENLGPRPRLVSCLHIILLYLHQTSMKSHACSIRWEDYTQLLSY